MPISPKWLIVVVPMCLPALPLRAGIVHFANPAAGEPGHFDWRWENVAGRQSWLDITLSAGQQTNTPGGNAVGQIASAEQGSVFNWHISAEPNDASLVLVDRDGFTHALDTGADISSSPVYVFFWPGGLHAIQTPADYIFSSFEEGEHQYIGVLTAGGNYGWIDVVRSGMNLTAFAWAYETEPGVAIAAGHVPAPGALALLGIGMFTAGKRRRRE